MAPELSKAVPEDPKFGRPKIGDCLHHALAGLEGQPNLLKAGFGRVSQDVDVDIVRAESLFVLAGADPDPL